MDYVTEREHLKEPEDGDRTKLAETIKQLSANGKSIRDIANDLRISKSKVGRILKM